MSVKVNIDKMVSDNPAAKKISISTTGNNVGECLADLIRQQPALKRALFNKNDELLYDKMVIVNGNYESENAAAKTVKDGDVITIIKFPEG